MSRQHGAINNFPDLSDIIAEKRRIWRRCQRYKQDDDTLELNRLINLIYKHIREFCIKKFENDVQEADDCEHQEVAH